MYKVKSGRTGRSRRKWARRQRALASALITRAIPALRLLSGSKASRDFSARNFLTVTLDATASMGSRLGEALSALKSPFEEVFSMSLREPRYRIPRHEEVREILIWHENQREPAACYVRAHWPHGWQPSIRVIDRAAPWQPGQLIYRFA